MAKENEPTGWPLKRPLTNEEWNQIIKAMVLRRVPEFRSISHEDLNRFVDDDVHAAFDAERVFTDRPARHVYIPSLIKNLMTDGLLREGVVEVRHEEPHPPLSQFDLVDTLISGRLTAYSSPKPRGEIRHVFRTDTTQMFLDLLPRHVEAVLNYLPATNVMDWMASMLPPDPEEDEQESRTTR